MLLRICLRSPLTRCSITVSAPLARRCISSSARLRSATPDWQALIGGREGIERKRKAFEDKYRAALEDKARAEGVSVEVLKERKAKAEREDAEAKAAVWAAKVAESASAAQATDEAGKGTPSSGAPAAEGATKAAGGKASSPVKPLQDILDLSKASTLTSSAISQLWTTYHQSKGFLSAAIPTETYERMAALGKKYPMFVLPLARDVVGDLPEGLPEGVNGAIEMHLLEWAFLPPPSTVHEPVPSPSTVLFTPLAEYQSRQSYAQPYLILTHYTDLSRSHGVILMRGEVSDNVALNAVDAQVLAVRLQMFYNPAGLGGEREKERAELLVTFHENPTEFDLEKLVKTAYELN